MSGSILHLHYDVCPVWLKLASRHLADAEECRLARRAAWQSDDEDAKWATLDREFESSMQAIVAAAIALESVHGALRGKTGIPSKTVPTKCAKKRTARYRQVAEVLRCAFALPNRDSVVLRDQLKEIFEYRNRAVHSSGSAKATVLHPELGTHFDWRFEAFRAENARRLVNAAHSIIHEVVTEGKPTTPRVAHYAGDLRRYLGLTNSGA